MDKMKEDKKNLGAEAIRKGRPPKETTFGRAKRSQKEKLSCSINLKLTAEDFKIIREKAQELGMKATQYVREMVLKGKVKSRFTIEELDLMRKLSGEANNLNQIAKKANQAGFNRVSNEVLVILEWIKAVFNDR
ncbi:MAG: MobC family plasmid mobilization relaxosome protein [Tannerella sp.]|jgi:predicted DNA binding CopG/RHH family protein|nr:MobC family plasmid mobilization relaxosome protein [Tannerella sp.]